MSDSEKRRGRPATGAGVQLNQRIPADLMARVESFADSHFLSRGEAIRVLLERGLNDDRK
jgi:hypothetical protein